MNFRFGGVLTPDGSRSGSTASAVAATTATAVGYTPPLSAQPAAYSQGSSGWQPLQRSGSLQPAMNDLQLDRSGSAKLSTVPRHDSSNDFAAVSPTDFLAGSQRAAVGLYAYPAHVGAGSADSPPPPPNDDGDGSSAGASPPGPPMSSVTPPPNVFLTGKSGNRASSNNSSRAAPSSNRASAVAAAASSSDVSPSRRTTQQRIADLARSDSVMGNYRPPNDEEEEI